MWFISPGLGMSLLAPAACRPILNEERQQQAGARAQDRHHLLALTGTGEFTLQREEKKSVTSKEQHASREGERPAVSQNRPTGTAACSAFSQKSCDECLKNVSCLWCYTNNTCIDYPVRSILPPSSLCSLSNARWGVCWINFEALIIAIAVVAGLILVSVAVCCCYCCYCRRRSRRPDEEEEQLARKREERRLQSLQRKHERKLKHDEIRKKYGLLQDSDNPYSRFENE
ncbi:PREDICTED: pituitary tumor-transforming gene 1 protein-interacting protein-like isoform X2 [Lepidothrix coronata]|uniref:Pituitary tumor-transforming gene 1 protein-interacting protein-like isoform X2 n=1 Tax=Lepidothrix coronata TaxID=321398 RepID=A0A6J0HI26_9PASS|nr:PREDICTED: pituitary tumor-transforming gene 1 protein-interacting protein-like isoform X2 [Lepidothrix coronata]